MHLGDVLRLRRLQCSVTLIAATILLGCGSCIGPAAATVRFGSNVFIGGHDFSHQTYGPKRRAVITLYRRMPRHPGCVWRADRDGGRTEVCRLRQRP